MPARENRQTGYRGRVGVYELLAVSQTVRELIMDRANAPDIVARAIADGDLVPRRDGYDKVLAGAYHAQRGRPSPVGLRAVFRLGPCPTRDRSW
ncbi:MAG: hypothetical protein R3B49_03770 [Phycisphaerales bacterium]